MTSFNELSMQQLTEAAERLGLEVDKRWSLNTLSGKMIEAGITIDQIKSSGEVLGYDNTESAADKFSSNASGGRVVLKMDRPNASYSIMGHRFTRDHPYVVMDEEEAIVICELDDGFHIAHPTEAANFYKKS